MTPYYADEWVTLYHGDALDVVDRLGLTADCIVTDPPYGETSLPWDRWPDGWPTAVSGAAKSMWCFGSMRMFLDRRDEFQFWRLSQDVVWRKPRARTTSTDRFARVHEHATHWYRGAWTDIHHDTQRVPYLGPPVAVPGKAAKSRPGVVRPMTSTTAYVDDGTRIMGSVLDGAAGDPRCVLHPTQKPVAVLDPLIRYACPPGGVVLDPFAGSGSTAEAARQSGRRAVLVEADERYCEGIARRMSQGVLVEDAAS